MSGCAMYSTRGLFHVAKSGETDIRVQHLETAYAYRDQIVLGYTATACRESQRGKGQEIACWAIAPLSVIRDKEQTGLGVSYQVHRGTISRAILASARPIPVVSSKPTAKPPEFDPGVYGSQMVVFDEGLSY